MFKWREYDELHQMKSAINKIVSQQTKSNGIINPEEIIKDFNKQKKQNSKKNKLYIPKSTKMGKYYNFAVNPSSRNRLSY